MSFQGFAVSYNETFRNEISNVSNGNGSIFCNSVYLILMQNDQMEIPIWRYICSLHKA